MARLESQRRHARARQRALQRLSRKYRKTFAEFLNEEKRREGIRVLVDR